MPEIVLDISDCEECCQPVECLAVGCPEIAARWRFPINLPFDPMLYWVLEMLQPGYCPPGYGVISPDEFLCPWPGGGPGVIGLRVISRTGPAPSGNVTLRWGNTPPVSPWCNIPGMGYCCCWNALHLQHTIVLERYSNCDCPYWYPNPSHPCHSSSGHYSRITMRCGVWARLTDCWTANAIPTSAGGVPVPPLHYGHLMLTVGVIIFETEVFGDEDCICRCCSPPCQPSVVIPQGIYSRAVYWIDTPWSCDSPNVASLVYAGDYSPYSVAANVAAMFPPTLTLTPV